MLTEVNPNVYFKLNESHVSLISEFREHYLNYFFDIMVSDWDSFNSAIGTGVSDIYISGELGFSLEDVFAIAEENHIKLRAIVNFAQIENPFNNNDTLKAFFIRPEDLDMYAEFIHSFEILDGGNQNILEVIYDVYQHDKLWFGELSELIANLETKIDNRTIIPQFGYFRLNCKKRCFKGSGCKLCLRIVELSETMTEKEFYLTD